MSVRLGLLAGVGALALAQALVWGLERLLRRNGHRPGEIESRNGTEQLIPPSDEENEPRNDSRCKSGSTTDTESQYEMRRVRLGARTYNDQTRL
jgi:hypothetical protein